MSKDVYLFALSFDISPAVGETRNEIVEDLKKVLEARKIQYWMAIESTWLLSAPYLWSTIENEILNGLSKFKKTSFRYCISTVPPSSSMFFVSEDEKHKAKGEKLLEPFKESLHYEIVLK